MDLSLRRRFLVVALMGASTAFGSAAVVAREPTAAAVDGPASSRIIARSDWDDYNGDGYHDLAIGMPYKTVSGDAGAGAVHVIYGSANGLQEVGDEVWHQDVADVPGAPEPADHFGWALASGDFNDDDYGDLAIGVPGEDWGPGEIDLGGVAFLYGWSGGLRPDTAQRFLSIGDLHGRLVETGANFGYALAAFRGGTQHSHRLAIGAPGISDDDGGAFFVGPHHVNHDTSYPDSYDRLWCPFGGGSRLGSSLAAGLLRGGTLEDVAAGAPFADVARPDDTIAADAGAVCVSISINSSGNLMRLRQGIELPGTAETGDQLGTSVAIGDLHSGGDYAAELMIGTPFEDEGSIVDAGRVTVVPGTSSGPDHAAAYNLTIDSPSMPGVAAAGDRFGTSVAIANVGGPTLPDLIMGAPGASVSGVRAAGAVIVRYSGRPISETRRWHQDNTGIVNAAERADRFGSSLAAGDFDDDGDADLAVGVFREDIGSAVDAGAVSVLYATSANGLAATGNEIWHQGSSGIGGSNASGDRFGFALD